MSSNVYMFDNFKGRVDYVAAVMSRRGNTSRRFDGCFEMYDGSAVLAAIVKRSWKNERLREVLRKYFCQYALQEAQTNAEECEDLDAWAKVLRDEATAQELRI
jgi:hypothetical protein